MIRAVVLHDEAVTVNRLPATSSMAGMMSP